jgi:hypothetical protein
MGDGVTGETGVRIHKNGGKKTGTYIKRPGFIGEDGRERIGQEKFGENEKGEKRGKTAGRLKSRGFGTRRGRRK